MIKVGIIGCGGIARAHKAAYKKIAAGKGNAVLEAICDIRPEQLEGFYDNVRTYTSVDEMLEKEQGKLDYVDICVPTFLHAEVAIKAMEADFHVLCEKPMARTLEQAERMIEVSKKTGKTLMVGHCCRFHEPIRMIRQIIESGEMGKVRSAEFYREGGSKEPMGWNNWYYDAALSGGAMLDLHIHDVDLIRMLFGMPQTVSVVGSSVMTKNGYDALSANFYYEDGKFVNALCDWSIAHDKYNTRTFRVNFENGFVFVDRTPGRQACVKVAEDGTVTDCMDIIAFDAHREEIEYFVDCMEQGKPVELCLPQQSYDAVRIVMAELKSADMSGERICV